MKRIGNIMVNKQYNPRNVRPNIPFDVDMVDSAMEKFIRQKYQERSLSDGKPRPPSRSEAGRSNSHSVDDSPPPPLPPKKGKLFGFGLRATSSAFPLSKHDKRNISVEPTFENTFHIYSEPPPRGKLSKVLGTDSGFHDRDLEEKLATLREMGFPDDKRNSSVLKGLGANLERTVESLVRLGEGGQTSKHGPNSSPYGSAKHTPSSVSFPEAVKTPTLQPPSNSNNPFENRSANEQIGLSFRSTVQRQQTANFNKVSEREVLNNPFDSVSPAQQPGQSLEQSLEVLQKSQPLFPNSTGGYPSQPPPTLYTGTQHSMTPPIPLIPQQYAYTASPATMNTQSNSYLQSMTPPQPTPSNPFALAIQNTPTSATSSNPFLNNNPFGPSPNIIQRQQVQIASNHDNPFGIPPPTRQSPPVSQQTPQFDNCALRNQQSFSVNGHISPYFSPDQYVQPSTQFPSQDVLSTSTYSNPQTQQLIHSQPYLQPGLPFHQQQAQYASPQLFQSQSRYSSQPQTLLPHPTGRIDKSSILALYNYPHLAPQPMPTNPDVVDLATESSAPVQPVSSDPFGGVGSMPAKRSVTMPVSFSSMSSPSTAISASRNPFLNASTGASATSSTGDKEGIGARHASQDSVSIANLENGRHSPDAFASLSARYVR